LMVYSPGGGRGPILCGPAHGAGSYIHHGKPPLPKWNPQVTVGKERKWGERGDSNPRPLEPQSRALPTELRSPRCDRAVFWHECRLIARSRQGGYRQAGNTSPCPRAPTKPRPGSASKTSSPPIARRPAGASGAGSGVHHRTSGAGSRGRVCHGDPSLEGNTAGSRP
jgi:hypothetical protein